MFVHAMMDRFMHLFVMSVLVVRVVISWANLHITRADHHYNYDTASSVTTADANAQLLSHANHTIHCTHNYRQIRT